VAKKIKSDRSSFPLRLPDAMTRRVEFFAEQEGISINQFISLALAEMLVKREVVERKGVPAPVLHVGEGHFHRVDLMQRAGWTVKCVDCSRTAVQNAFTSTSAFSAITFHNDVAPPRQDVVLTARTLSAGPFILFQGSSIACDLRPFDLVIGMDIPPRVWLKSLAETIEASRQLVVASQRLRAECAGERMRFEQLRALSDRNRAARVDAGQFWSG
jgi:hypothetical protein